MDYRSVYGNKTSPSKSDVFHHLFPQIFSSDCSAKLTIAYQFRKDANESASILRGYSEVEKFENEVYENTKCEEEEEYFDYENIEELEDESSQDGGKKYEQASADSSGGNDAVSFLAGILKPKPEDGAKKIIEFKKLPSKKSVSDAGFDDPNRKHCCNVCNKKFQKRSNLIDHLRLHANVKVFACEFCEKSFVQAGNYKAHLRTHTKEKPYACHYCNKAYSQSSSLKIHIRSHTQEKNYLCEICDKAFTNASDLGKHKLIHDPVKKFRCEECNRPFTQKIHLRKHLEKHHPDMEFEFGMKDGEETMLKIENMAGGSKIVIEEIEQEQYELLEDDIEEEEQLKS